MIVTTTKLSHNYIYIFSVRLKEKVKKSSELDTPRYASVEHSEQDPTDVECAGVDKTKSPKPFASQPTEPSYQVL